MKPIDTGSPSQSSQSNGTKPQTPSSASRHQKSKPKPGSLMSSWGPRVREREAKQECEVREAQMNLKEARARNSTSMAPIEISDDEGSVKEVSLKDSPQSCREITAQMLSEPAKPESASRFESPSLFVSQDKPRSESLSLFLPQDDRRSESPSLFLPEDEPRRAETASSLSRPGKLLKPSSIHSSISSPPLHLFKGALVLRPPLLLPAHNAHLPLSQIQRSLMNQERTAESVRVPTNCHLRKLPIVVLKSVERLLMERPLVQSELELVQAPEWRQQQESYLRVL
ncbi:hypothetical protein ONS95_008703 [Cadophora gregata]|uniref:uncharacterized protein n=1 Tax=Cadophora gregata TaxID=51156 RepID=UPI0026DBC531|nr:uncharacterized protein ONS95_008703 [Cadophora gregata]KAK0123693.1 hypothetical protein ONS95_008703 [Cadophora gregata]KAK0130038.1 hypothetical protein ONS96_000576 [Cadophora gregata f. sp. sojae]